MGLGNASDLLEIIAIVGRDIEKAFRIERAINRIQKIICHEATAMVSALGPGIRKQQVKGSDRSLRQEITYGVANLDIQDPNIFERGRFATRFGDSTGQFVDPDKIALGILLRQLADERTVAAAEVNLERCVPAEHRREIERRNVGLGNQLDHGIG